MFTYLLTTKLHIPPSRPALVSRPRLIERLNAGRHGKLTLVSAPAGFGKTTLVSTWLQNVSSPVGWLSLDENDNDPVRFVTYLVAALQQIEPTIGRGVEVMLQSSPTSAPDALIGSLINDLAATSEPFILVLDDYHLVNRPVIHQALAFLLRHQPPQMHLVLISRSDPPLQMARLRARGQLLEISPADLRFSSQEATRFLNQVMGLNLTPSEVAALSERTEGWIAGLQLAALSMRSHEDLSRFVQSFSGSHRYVLDYLLEEVFSNQSQRVQTFLLQTSILSRLTGPLCDAVTGQTDGQAMLLRLERANLFLIALDDERRWYRYHHLFADFLRHYYAADKVPPLVLGGVRGGLADVADDQASCHQKAASWYEANGLFDLAVKHALATGDMAEAGRVIALASGSMLKNGLASTLLGWLDALPDRFVRTDPELALNKGWALYLSGQIDGAESYAQAAQEHDSASAENRNALISLRAFLAFQRGHFSEATELATAALSEESEPILRGVIWLNLALAQWVMGSLSAAAQSLKEAIRFAQQAGNMLVAVNALNQLALIRDQKAQRHDAIALCQQAIDLCVDEHGEMPTACIAYVTLGTLYLEANELSLAHQQIKKGLDLAQQCGMVMTLFNGNMALAQWQMATGEAEAALSTIRETRHSLHHATSVLAANPFGPLAQLQAIEADIQLKQGNLAAAMRWFDSANLSADEQTHSELATAHYFYQIAYLNYARVLLAKNRLREAQRLLEKLAHSAQKGKRDRQLITIYILQAETRQRLDQQVSPKANQALAYLSKAIQLAAPEGYLRPFLDESPTIAHLLSHLRHLAPTFVERLLNAFQEQPPALNRADHQPLIEPLSKREIEVLQLVAAALSNREIAKRLIISVGTVKTHVHHIYRKMGVRNRMEAVMQAQKLKLV